MGTKLNLNSLDSLGDNVTTPGYDRMSLSPGILHIGVGNFHRAHQAVYLDKLFNLGLDHDWGIVGAGVKSYDAKMRDALQAQDWMSTVVELDPKGYTARVCGAMIDFVEIDPAALIDRLATPEIRIVSLTITEGGYYIDENTGGFNSQHPEIVHDGENPDDPQTVFGVLVAGLAKRRQKNLPAFTVMSCDNLPGNGHVAQQAVVGMAKLFSAEVASWIEAEVSFPNGMVDCITPATGERERALIEEHFNIEDASPVVCEPFRQWVLEDKFSSGRPALEKAGVEFVDDVAPYELMKLRILNGGHASISYLSALLGIHFVHDAMANPLVSGFLDKLAKEEIIPVVPAVPGFDFLAYFNVVTERFSNPEIGDTIPRLCLDGSNRQPKFIFPSITDRLDRKLAVDGLALEVALWCRYCAGTEEDGTQIVVDDLNSDRLGLHARRAKEEPGAFLELTDIFGPLSSDEVFATAFSRALESLWDAGVTKTLEAYIDD